MRLIIAPPETPRKDPVVKSLSIPGVRVTLSPNLNWVKPGTPLVGSALGWEVAGGPDDKVVLFASSAGHGGATIPVQREIVLEYQGINPPFTPGAHYKIGDIDQVGWITFIPTEDDSGPHVALTLDTILLTPDF